MARFTELGDADVAAIAAAYELGAPRALRPLEGGTINSNFALEVAPPGGGTARWFVRINEGKAEADVAYEAELVSALAAAGVATPEPRRAHGGRAYLAHRGHLVSVFPWIDGVHRDAAEVSEADCAALGGALADLHRAGQPLADRFARDGIYTTAHIAARVAGFAHRTDPALAAAIPLLRDELAHLTALAGARAAAPRGIIHGDLFRDNVLFDAAGRLVALIDFEQASVGSLVYDLAVCLNAWCYDEALAAPRVRALVAGYEAVRPLAAEERALLPVEVRAAAARFATTRITDVYLAASGVPGKDFRRYLARLEAWRALGERWLAWLA